MPEIASRLYYLGPDGKSCTGAGRWPFGYLSQSPRDGQDPEPPDGSIAPNRNQTFGDLEVRKPVRILDL